MQVLRPYGGEVRTPRSERQQIDEVVYKIRQQRRLREAADRERRRRAKIEMLEFLARQRHKRRMSESVAARRQRYVRALTVGLEESIGAGRMPSDLPGCTSGGVR